jgi:hypothetical protein
LQPLTLSLSSSHNLPAINTSSTASNKSNLKVTTSFNLPEDDNQEKDMITDPSSILPRLSLQQQQQQQLQNKVTFYIPDQRLSTGSNMSTSSTDSMSDNQSQGSSSYSQFSPTTSCTNSTSTATSLNTKTTNSINNKLLLQPGICIKQKHVTVKEIKIASKAIEMITCFLQYRKDCISHVLTTKMFNECMLDVLTGSVSAEIRAYTQKFLYKLSQTQTFPFNCPHK